MCNKITLLWCPHLFIFPFSLVLCFCELLFLVFLSECLDPCMAFFSSFYSHLKVQFLRCLLRQLLVSTCSWCIALSKLCFWVWGSAKAKISMCLWNSHLAQTLISNTDNDSWPNSLFLITGLDSVQSHIDGD